VSWVVALALYVAVVDVDAAPGSGLTAHTGPLPGAEVGAILAVIGAWQVLFFVVWRGWPIAEWRHRWQRIVAGNIVVIGGGLLTYAVVHDLAGVPSAAITAGAGSLIAAGLVIGMQFEGWIRSQLGSFLVVVLLAVALMSGSGGAGRSACPTRPRPRRDAAESPLGQVRQQGGWCRT